MIECFKNETDVEEERHIRFDLLSSYTVYGINSVQWLNLSVLPPSLIKVSTDVHIAAAHLHRSYMF